MVKSMTGFGRGSVTEGSKTFIIEMKSVNHRFQETSVKLPRTFLSLEDKIRRLIADNIKRGKVDIYITQKDYEKQSTNVALNLELAKSYLESLRIINQELGLRDDITVGSLSRFPEVITLDQKEEDLDKIWSMMEVALKEACDKLLIMRNKEGEKLKEDILIKLCNLKELLMRIEERSPKVVEEYKNKLSGRLKDLLDDKQNYDEGRVAMEIAIFADKASIDEELTRLNSHIEQMRSAFELDESIGRKLDFIVQEMNREANTIASKANDLEILKHTLGLKTVIEKVREQVQNIE
ncbi:YicC/YloC family endoribonuclease [Hathewaya histolytica]|uniref:Protein YicC n=1 Tax=Hathewaya histolytica TaxID=1498 RepID=A0A4U9REE4_HATHI|nr:YicC/YloC family endoribonuclease [Hathewaya histolytica]VTQ90182.1 protein YicC [Hathewaya histolytica]